MSEEDYAEIIDCMLESRQEWDGTPEIVHLTLKALQRWMCQHELRFQEHKVLLNEASIKCAQRQLMDQQCSFSDSLNDSHHTSIRQNPNSEQVETRERGLDQQGLEEVTIVMQALAKKKFQEIESLFQNQCRKLSERLDTITSVTSKCEEAICALSSHSGTLQALNENESLQDRRLSVIQRSLNTNRQHLQALMERVDQSITESQLWSILKENKQNITQQEDSHGKREEKKVQNDPRLNLQKQMQQLKSKVSRDLLKIVRIDQIQSIVNTIKNEHSQKYSNLQKSLSSLEQQLREFQKDAGKRGETPTPLISKRHDSPSKCLRAINMSLTKIEATLNEKSVIEFNRLEKHIHTQLEQFHRKLLQQIDLREKNMCQVIQETLTHSSPQPFLPSRNQTKTQATQIKSLMQINVVSRYIYFGAKETPKDALVTWDKEQLNYMIENFLWRENHVTIAASGLYKIEAGLYGGIEAPPWLLINGETAGIFSRPEVAAQSRGCVFRECLLIPAKSKIAVLVSGQFYGQAFLQITKM